MLLAVINPATAIQCDLCAEQWVFILSAGRRTGTTLALNSLPTVQLGSENQGSLAAVGELYARHLETRPVGSAGEQDQEDDDTLTLCTLQQWYRTPSDTSSQRPANASSASRFIRGFFKDLLLSSDRSTLNDRESSVPAEHHRPVSESLMSEPLWLRTLDDVFPCSTIM